jgi:DNA-binding XRE family transcriptional regulator
VRPRQWRETGETEDSSEEGIGDPSRGFVAIRYNKTHNAVIAMETIDARPEQKADIARRFKRLRDRAMFTQADLARLIGVCRSTVNRIERRRVMLRIKSWRRFVEFEAKHRNPAVRMPTYWS